MPLSKKQRKELESILWQLKTAEDYIRSESIAICRHKKMATTTLDYSNQSGQALTPLAKDCGSDLVYLFAARLKLEKFIEAHP